MDSQSNLAVTIDRMVKFDGDSHRDRRGDRMRKLALKTTSIL